MFVKTLDNKLIALRTISHVSAEDETTFHRTITCDNGDQYVVHFFDFDESDYKPKVVIAALADTMAITVDDTGHTYREPVIGWRLMDNGSMKALTMSGEDYDAVKFPNDEVHTSSHFFPDTYAYRDYVMKQKQRQEQQALKTAPVKEDIT